MSNFRGMNDKLGAMRNFWLAGENWEYFTLTSWKPVCFKANLKHWHNNSINNKLITYWEVANNVS